LGRRVAHGSAELVKLFLEIGEYIHHKAMPEYIIQLGLERHSVRILLFMKKQISGVKIYLNI